MNNSQSADFTRGILHFAAGPRIPEAGSDPVVDGATGRITTADARAAAQVVLAADAMRYLTLLATATKASGHPGGFASSAELIASCYLSGIKDIVTEVGHHAPGYYSAVFLDRSLEELGIRTVAEFCGSFREMGGLLGHVTGAIPGIMAPAGPLGQGQHFALAAAMRHPERIVPLTIGDGGIGEPYVMSGILHFRTLFPAVTNFIPSIIWNGYSQEHHSICSTWSTDRFVSYLKAHGIDDVLVVDAADYGDPEGNHGFADSTTFSAERRVAFAGAVLQAVADAVTASSKGRVAGILLKQIKGAGMHVHGSKSHNLTPVHTLENPDIVRTLESLALSPEDWDLVRSNYVHAARGPAGRTIIAESPRTAPAVPPLPRTAATKGDKVVPTAAIGEMVVALSGVDPEFLVTNADGNEASGMMNINRGLGVRHPVADDIYEQRPTGMVYEPLSEDACAGLAAATALFGGRALWNSYESFAVNGLPVWQTVCQAMSELRRPAPSLVALFTAGALEQGRNGWTHQRPEIESYFAALMRNGNVFPIFPVDAVQAQEAFAWIHGLSNCAGAIFCSKNPVEVLASTDAATEAMSEGALVLRETEGPADLVLAVVGDLLAPVALRAAAAVADSGAAVRVVAVVNPRLLYRPIDIAEVGPHVTRVAGMSDRRFDEVFGGRALVAVTGGSSAVLEPLLLRSRHEARDLAAWRRGETTAGMDALLELNDLHESGLVERCRAVLGSLEGTSLRV